MQAGQSSGISAVKLFIGSIPRSTRESDIRAECSKFGAITSLFYNEEQGRGRVTTGESSLVAPPCSMLVAPSILL